jgi:hypothetical protein
MLSDKAIQEFKDIFKKEYGQDLTDAEAREQGERLVKFFEILIRVDRRTRKNKYGI